jgi:hypothetical protein
VDILIGEIGANAVNVENGFVEIKAFMKTLIDVFM